MGPATFHFFVFRVVHGKPHDERCPCGGLVITAWTAKSMLWKAFDEAARRFPCRPGELLVLKRVDDTMDVCHAALMARDWERSFAEFEELMGAVR